MLAIRVDISFLGEECQNVGERHLGDRRWEDFLPSNEIDFRWSLFSVVREVASGIDYTEGGLDLASCNERIKSSLTVFKRWSGIEV